MLARGELDAAQLAGVLEKRLGERGLPA